MEDFVYKCACSYPYGPHTTHCIVANDRRLEAECQKFRDCGDEETAIAHWDTGVKVIHNANNCSICDVHGPQYCPDH